MNNTITNKKGCGAVADLERARCAVADLEKASSAMADLGGRGAVADLEGQGMQWQI